MSKFIKEAAQVFADYPKQKEVYFTEDGSAFVDEGNAKAHARSIGKPKYETIAREEVVSGKKADNTGATDSTQKGYEELTVEDLKEAVKGRQLEIGTAKRKADLIAILEEDDKAKSEAEKTTEE